LVIKLFVKLDVFKPREENAYDHGRASCRSVMWGLDGDKLVQLVLIIIYHTAY